MKKLLLKRYRNTIKTISEDVLKLYDAADPSFLAQRLKEEVAKLENVSVTDIKTNIEDIIFFGVLLHERCVQNGAVTIKPVKNNRTRERNPDSTGEAPEKLPVARNANTRK